MNSRRIVAGCLKGYRRLKFYLWLSLVFEVDFALMLLSIGILRDFESIKLNSLACLSPMPQTMNGNS